MSRVVRVRNSLNYAKALALTGAVSLLGVAQAVQVCELDSTVITTTTPVADFTDHGNGTVTHSETGLMWMQCRLGQDYLTDCSGTSELHSWVEARDAADRSSFAGYSNWRLPTPNELRSIVELSCVTPAINLTVFPNVEGTESESTVWSSFPRADNVFNAWVLRFDYGSSEFKLKTVGYAVRLVRNP